jgi:PadR family transcriptional regulator PadR
MGVRPRMTIPTLRVLAALYREPLSEHYGLELCRAAGLPSGSVYPILARLENAGWVVGSWEDIDEAAERRRRRRYYRLTGTGLERVRAALVAHESALRPLWPGDLGPGTGPVTT